MSALEMSHIDLEQGNHRRSLDGSEASVTADGNHSFSDAEESSCYSQFYSTTGGSYDEYSFACVDPEIGWFMSDSRRASSVSDCSVEVEGVVREMKVHLAKVERVCRICHLGLESDSHESGFPIELGCSCKDDLAAAHKQCAETWFKIKGNKTCEICNSVARNIAFASENESTDQLNESNNATATATATAVSASSVPQAEPRSFWRSHRLLNFLLACMVLAFVISWLFHFKVPDS